MLILTILICLGVLDVLEHIGERFIRGPEEGLNKRLPFR